MILDIDPDAPVPVYEQIRLQVTRMVTSGALPLGARLPTIRQLANDLGLAKGTVAKAYTTLESTGVVRSSGTRGTFVLAPGESPPLDPTTDLAEVAKTYAIASQQLGIGLRQACDALAEQWGSAS